MKLLLIFAAVLAFSLAEEKKTEKSEILEDSEAEASVNIELLKEGADLKPAASSYIPPSQRPPQWNQPNYVPKPVQNDYYQPPKDNSIQPIHTATGSPPPNVQSDYYYPIYHPHPPTTTTPVPVIKNEQYFGENGYYKYEYQLGDGTHVGEEGYFTDAKQSEESLVKKGWYSYRGADGKTYTVTYWADKFGFHAYGDHLPTPLPPPAAVKPGFDNKPQNDYPSPTPAPVQYPTKPPVQYPTKPVVQYPTPAPIQYPSQAPIQYPTQAPIQYPTQGPIQYPTQYPSHGHYPTQTPAPVYQDEQQHHYQHQHHQQSQYPNNNQQTYPQHQQVYYPQKNY